MDLVDCCTLMHIINVKTNTTVMSPCVFCLQSEKDGFATFHVYVCAALLAHFSKRIKAKKDFQVQVYDLYII